MPKRKQFIRHNQPVLTRLNPHQGNTRYLKGGGLTVVSSGAPQFWALTPHPTTYEMLGVRIGTGDLTTTHADTLYAPDFNGVYQAFPADAPVWAGGRCELVGGPGTDVVKVFANDGPGGAPLPEMPYLQYYPGSTNSAFYSNTLDATAWTHTVGVDWAVDAVGLDGTPNSAVTVGDSSGSTVHRIYATTSSSAAKVSDTAQHTMVLWLKKDADETVFPRIIMGLLGGTPQNQAFTINKNTGVVAPLSGTGTTEVVDAGGWWKILVEMTSVAGNTNGNLDISPAYSSTNGGSQDNTLQGSVVVGQVEFYYNKTIAEVRGLGPVFTTSAAVSVAATTYSFDIANHNDDAGAYFVENNMGGYKQSHALLALRANANSLMSVSGNAAAAQLTSWTLAGASSVTALGSLVYDTPYKFGNSYSQTDNQLSINANDAWGTEIAYAGFNLTNNKLELCYHANFMTATKLRNLQRYDITSYQDGKDIIDGLMA